MTEQDAQDAILRLRAWYRSIVPEAQSSYEDARHRLDEMLAERGITEPIAVNAAHETLLSGFRPYGVKTSRERAEEELDAYLRGNP